MKLLRTDIEALEACETPEAYNVLARRIKAFAGGEYPDDWFERVIKPGGIHDRLKVRWGNPEAFSISLQYPKAKP